MNHYVRIRRHSTAWRMRYGGREELNFKANRGERRGAFEMPSCRRPLCRRRGRAAPLMFVLFGMLLSAQSSRLEAQALIFEPSRPLTAGAESDRGDDSQPRLSYDGAGTWVAIWRSRDEFGATIGRDWDIISSASTDDGQTWSTPAIVNSNAFGDKWLDIEPSVAGDGNGVWIAVWESYDSLDGTIGPDADILYSVSSDNTASWSPARALSSRAAASRLNDRVPRITTDGKGVWIVAWESFEAARLFDNDDDLFFSRSADNGLNWSNPQILNKPALYDGVHDQGVDIVTDGRGVWIAAWTRAPTFLGDEPDWDVFYTRSVDSGVTWTPSAPLNTNASTDHYNDWAPRLATDGRGNWMAVWASNENLDGRIGRDSDLLFARSEDGGATWSRPAPLVAAFSADAVTDDRPSIATDGRGHWAVAWQSRLDPEGTLGGDQEILISVSLDDGQSWPAPMPLDPAAPLDSADDRGPSLGTDRKGNWICVWESLDKPASPTGKDMDIRFSAGKLSIAKSEIWRRDER